jgi:hypothetical protein
MPVSTLAPLPPDLCIALMLELCKGCRRRGSSAEMYGFPCDTRVSIFIVRICHAYLEHEPSSGKRQEQSGRAHQRTRAAPTDAGRSLRRC